MAEGPLSALCSICYTNTPKYCCPRCTVRTCSLPCYKRHQQRASCNGQRDPSAYVSKSQLVTPAGIDRDYNFLTKIEHAVGQADKDHGERSASGYNLQKRWNDDGILSRYLRDNRILVDKAPKGMSRQKANQTRWLSRSKRFVWTVEWVDLEGGKRLCEVYERDTIGDAYAAMLAEREKESRKRKRGLGEGAPVQAEQQHQDTPIKAAANKLVADANIHDRGSGEGLDAQNTAVLAAQADKAAEEQGTQITPTAPSQRPEAPEPSDGADSDQQPSAHQPYFYLLKAHTTSTSKVLIPITKSATLTSTLHNQTVLEFPTIHVLNSPPDQLQEPFMTETTYLDVKRKEDLELEGIMSAASGSKLVKLQGGLFGNAVVGHDDVVGGGGGRGGTAGSGEAEEWDERKILEMLKRDVKT